MNRRYLRYLPVIAGFVAVVLVVSVVLYLVVGFLKDKPTNPKNLVQQITLIQPPPPPPVEKPPEMKQEEVDIPKPQETPPDKPQSADNLPPVGDNLGLDAEGGAGGDSFGLVGIKGGQNLIGGDGGSRFGSFISLVQEQVSTALSEDDEIRKQKYSVIVHIWVNSDGKVERFELVKGTGRQELDKKLKMDLSEIRSFDEAPSVEMPQPIKLRISSRT